MTDYQAILNETSGKLLKALDHLEYSYKKVQTLPDDLSSMDDEQMETWESFSSRFSRVSDIFIKQYLRAKVAIEEPGFKGTTRDYLNQAEKLSLIEDAQQWVHIRELGCVEDQEFENETLTNFFKTIKDKCPILLSIRNVISGK